MLLDLNCHIIGQYKLDFQMINDHMEEAPMILETILDSPVSANFPAECSHMSELSLCYAQQMDQPAVLWPNTKPTESCKTVNCC